MAITEDDSAPLLYRDSWLRGMDTSEEQIYNENNEPPDVKQARWRSIRIIYTVVFLNAICFTILLPSLWTYLQVLDPGASTSKLGWTVAAFSLGQLVASPIFGAWANSRNSHKEPICLSFTLAALSYSFYTYLESIPGPKDYYMIAARAMLGFSAGNVAVLRSYVASATTLKERTVTMANVNICASAGFVIGPLLQAAFVPISYPGPFERPFLHVDMYTTPALLATVLSSVSASLVLLIFSEYRIKDEPGAEAASIQFLPCPKASTDYLAVFTCILNFFSTAITFQIFQTLTTPLIMHNFAWSKAKATFIQGMVTGGISVLAIFIYFIVKILTKRVSERALLMTGFLFTAAACFVFVPFGNTLPPRGMAPIRPGNVSHSNPSPWIVLPRQLAAGSAYHHVDESVRVPPTSAMGSVSKASQSRALPKGRMPNSVELHGVHFKISDTFTKKLKQLRARNSTKRSNNAILSSMARKAQQNHKRVLHVITESPITHLNFLQEFLRDRKVRSKQQIFAPLGHKSMFPVKTRSYQATKKVNISQALRATTLPVPFSTAIPEVSTPASRTSHTAEGCPWNLAWCAHVPVLHLAQYAVGTLLYGVGYPLCHVLTFTIFSKVLGSKPQGLWMGFFAASGSLAGIVGPVLISHVYDLWGPRVAFTGCTAAVMVVALYTFAVIHRLIPFSQRQKQIGPLTAN